MYTIKIGDSQTGQVESVRNFERMNFHFEKMANRPELMWLGRNTNHLPAHPKVRDAMLDCIRNEDYHVYAPPFGLEELRRLVVDHLGLDDMAALITDGAVAGLYHVCHTFLKPGDQLITTDPTWEWTLKFAGSIGASVKKINIYGQKFEYRLDPARLRTAVGRHCRCIYLIDPNNPLGTSCTESEIAEICDIARSLDAYLIQDCTYRDFAFQHHLAAKFYPERTITIWSFSKWLGTAGLRIGAVVANSDLVETLSQSPPNILGSNIVSQRGAIQGLKSKSDWFPQVLATTRENQALVFKTVNDLPGMLVPVYPSDGNFLIIECAQAGISPEVICRLMDQHDIMVRQGSYHSERFGDQFIKVSLSVPRGWVEQFCRLLPNVVHQAKTASLGDNAFWG